MLKHAFIISVHKNFEQIRLLVDSLSFGDIFIHVDLKNNELYHKLCAEYINSKNIQIIGNRVSVNWSGFSQVEATLNLLAAVKESKKKYDYIHFISGQDLLLLPQRQLDAFIELRGKGKEFIEIEDIGQYKWRIKCFNFFRENPKNRTPIYRGIDIILRLIQLPFVHRNNLKDMKLYKGSQWFSITYECAMYILKIAPYYVNDFKYTACPDEHFFQILIMNSMFKDKVDKKNYRYIVFEGINTSPKTLSINDLPHFMNGNFIFARKFDMDIDKMVIDKVLSKF